MKGATVKGREGRDWAERGERRVRERQRDTERERESGNRGQKNEVISSVSEMS